MDEQNSDELDVQSTLNLVIDQICTSERDGLIKNGQNCPNIPKPLVPPKPASHRRVLSDASVVYYNDKPKTDKDSASARSEVRELHMQWMKQALIETKIKLANLQAEKYNETVDMERENQHFYVCEMVLSTIEQMKWHQSLANMQPAAAQYTAVLQQAIRPMTAPSRSDSPASFQPHSSTSGIKSFDTLSDGYPSSELSLDSAGPSSAYASMSPLRSNSIDCQQESFSMDAECIAMSLLSHFAHNRSVEMDEGEWMVPFSDVPQSRLPMPQSTPVPPDQIYATQPGDDTAHRVRIRGTFDWAPPRPALIFKLHHPTPRLKEGLASQNWKCAGCRLSVDNTVLFKRVRYCEYSGRYFCPCCHRGARAVIPARVLYKWDFRFYPVSDYAARFLEENYTNPAIRLNAHCPKLYQNVKTIRSMMSLRRQLLHMWRYIRTCRVADQVVTEIGKLRDRIESLPSHYLHEADLFSMKDLVDTNDRLVQKSLDPILFYAKYHIINCQFCQAQGFFCEICEDNKDLLFPFLESTVYCCTVCGACIHIKCMKKLKMKFACPKCERMRSRQ